MPSAEKLLAEVQENILGTGDFSGPDIFARLNFQEVEGLFHIDYRGLTYRERYWYDEEEDEEREDEEPEAQLPFFEVLVHPEVASKVASLSLDARPDQGGNGTRSWDFSWLLEQEVTFPVLQSLLIRYDPFDDDRLTIVTDGGQLAGWLKKAPKLVRLTTPSAPDAEFFKVEHQPLDYTQVYSGWYPENFILNLSCHPKPLIGNLDWWEVDPRTRRRDYQEVVTPYAHFEALVTSPACPPMLTLRTPELDEAQVEQLATLHCDTGKRQGWRDSKFEVVRLAWPSSW